MSFPPTGHIGPCPTESEWLGLLLVVSGFHPLSVFNGNGSLMKSSSFPPKRRNSVCVNQRPLLSLRWVLIQIFLLLFFADFKHLPFLEQIVPPFGKKEDGFFSRGKAARIFPFLPRAQKRAPLALPPPLSLTSNRRKWELSPPLVNTDCMPPWGDPPDRALL